MGASYRLVIPIYYPDLPVHTGVSALELKSPPRFTQTLLEAGGSSLLSLLQSILARGAVCALKQPHKHLIKEKSKNETRPQSLQLSRAMLSDWLYSP